MPDFKQLRAEGNAQGERNDCSVIAVAVVCGVSYATAHRAMAANGRRPRGRAEHGSTEQSVRDLGCETRHLMGWDFSTPENVQHKTLPLYHVLRKGKTMTSIEPLLQRHYSGRRFLIGVRGHIAAFDGQRLQDWSQGRRHKVIKIVEVV